MPFAPQEGKIVFTTPKNSNGLGHIKILLVSSFLITTIVLGLIHNKRHPEALKLHDTTHSRDNTMSGLTKPTIPINCNIMQAMAVLAPMLAVLCEGPPWGHNSTSSEERTSVSPKEKQACLDNKHTSSWMLNSQHFPRHLLQLDTKRKTVRQNREAKNKAPAVSFDTDNKIKLGNKSRNNLTTAGEGESLAQVSCGSRQGSASH